jgi:membrane fusion protein, multidrug efflux system
MQYTVKPSSFFLLSALALVACGGPGETARGDWGQGRGERAVRVVAEPVSFEADTSRVQAVGTARAKASAEIFPEVSGEVVAVNFSAGTPVKRGQVLVRLESRAEELAVRRAEVAVRDAEQLIDRYERIEVPGAISDSQVDTARTALEAAKIDLELARNSLSDRTVRAPFAGYTGISDIDPGARVTPQTQITRLDDRSTLFVDFSAPEQVFGGLAPGDVLRMEPFATPDESVEAVVEAIDSGIDPATRSFIVRASIDNGDDALRPGMSFRVNFDLPGETYPAVPETSILYGGDGAYVWTVVDDEARRTDVDVVARREGRVLVRGDITPETRVVIEGVQKVRSGSRVEVEAPSPEPSVAPRTAASANSVTR